MWTAVLLAAALLVTGDAKTQQQPAAGGNPLDVVPEKMPFNTPYGTPISLEKAQTAVQAAVAEANKRGWPLNVAVVDSSGNLSHLLAWMADNLPPFRYLRAHNFAAKYRRPTKAIEEGVQKGITILMTLDDVIASCRRHSANRGWQADWCDRLLRCYRVSGRGSVLSGCGYDQQIAAVLHV